MLKIRLPSGQMVLKGVDFQSPVDWLKTQIQNESKIEPTRQKLKLGFPPQEVSGQKDQVTFNQKKLSDIGLKSGESVIVEETNDYHVVESSVQATASSEGTSKSSSARVLKPEQYSDVPARPSDVSSFDSSLISESEVTKRVIEADNSCLFNAFAYCLEGSVSRKNKRARALRRVVRDCILNNPFEFNDAILGKPAKEYCDWIMRDDSWGGSLEIMILSQFYKIRVESYDVISCRRDIYGQEDPEITAKIFLIYDGIHYDALAINPVGASGPEELDLTVFPALEDVSSQKALNLVKQYHQKHQFTDTANFVLKCLQCGEYIKGEKEATMHAKKTGHTKFGENKK